MATASSVLAVGGLFTIAITVRYRKRPPLWEYLVFFVLAILMVTFGPPSSPLMGALPLMLSCVLDYIDKQRQKRAVLSKAALAGGSRPAERSTE
jgi:ABC-type polysaccharide/polyol phosphate export permease